MHVQQTHAHSQLAMEGLGQGYAPSSALRPQWQGCHQGVLHCIRLQ